MSRDADNGADSNAPTEPAVRGLADADVDRLRATVSVQSAEDTFSGRFEIVGEAGSGGMGRVYEAIDCETGHRVAIKVITGLPSPGDRARFAAEAEVLERLDHPAIVDYVRHGVTTRGEPYLAMEWLVGESLAKRLERGPLSVAEAAILGERIADALDHAHRAGIVHRDLKPSNIFLVDSNVEHAHLIDFGVAKVADRDLTHTGQLIGTPGYMAPEQVRGEKSVNQRVDLFALGCVLYESLTGRAPFRGAEVMEVLARLLLEEPPHVEAIVPDVPPRLAHLIGALLAKDAQHRLGDARVACTELAAVRAALAAGDQVALALRPEAVPVSRRREAVTVNDRVGAERLPEPAATAVAREPAKSSRIVVAVAALVGIAAVGTAVVALRGSTTSSPPVAATATSTCDERTRAGCEAACKQDSAEACFFHARALHDGVGTAVDHEAGRGADLRACELGFGRSCYEYGVSMIAVALRDPRPDAPLRLRRLDDGARMLQKGCDLRFWKSCRRLGKEYSAGFGSLVPDATKAFALVELACTNDDHAACNALRDMIINLAGTPELRAGAVPVLEAACRRGAWTDDGAAGSATPWSCPTSR